MTTVPYIDLAIGAHTAGFRGDGAATIVAIAEMETRRGALLPDDGRVAEPNGSTSFGVYQVNSIHLQAGGLLYGWDEQRLAADHSYGAAASWLIAKQGTSFTPWTTYRERHERFRDAWLAGSAAAKVALDARDRLARRDALLTGCERLTAQLRDELVKQLAAHTDLKQHVRTTLERLLAEVA